MGFENTKLNLGAKITSGTLFGEVNGIVTFMNSR